MNENIISPLFLLLIVALGLVLIVFGENSKNVIKYLFAPVFWIFGSLLRLAILAAVVFVGFQMIPESVFDGIDFGIPPVPPDTQQTYAYPVGDESSGNLRRGQHWRVSQDFADTDNPATAGLSGQHLGEDWVPANREAVGEPVYAIADGTVIRNERNDSYGFVVMTQHESTSTSRPTVTALYGHIIPSESLGTTVDQGEQIGVIASSTWNGCNRGCTFTAPGCTPRPGSGRTPSECRGWDEHLHFELRDTTARESVGFGYSTNQTGFLNPTNTGSTTENNGGGWIDRWD